MEKKKQQKLQSLAIEGGGGIIGNMSLGRKLKILPQEGDGEEPGVTYPPKRLLRKTTKISTTNNTEISQNEKLKIHKKRTKNISTKIPSNRPHTKKPQTNLLE